MHFLCYILYGNVSPFYLSYCTNRIIQENIFPFYVPSANPDQEVPSVDSESSAIQQATRLSTWCSKTINKMITSTIEKPYKHNKHLNKYSLKEIFVNPPPMATMLTMTALVHTRVVGEYRWWSWNVKGLWHVLNEHGPTTLNWRSPVSAYILVNHLLSVL